MEKFIVNFYNVGHGSCTHIITPNGKQILIDVGSRDEKSVVDYIARRYYTGIQEKRIDYFILTHVHEDHMSDIKNLINILSPLMINRPKRAFDIPMQIGNERYNVIARCANAMHHEYIYPVADEDNVKLDKNNGGVVINIIQPPDSFITEDINSYSCIVIMTYGGYKFVFTGDNTKTQLQAMIDSNYDQIREKVSNAFLLLAPHHGRSGEFCEDFVKVVNPRVTVVSDGSVKCDSQERVYEDYGKLSRGIYFKNRDVRFTLTTRNDGNISVVLLQGILNGSKLSYYITNDREYY